MKQETHSIHVNDKTCITSVWLIPREYRKILIIAHGAGNDMNSGFISAQQEAIAKHNILTIKFNFPYTEQGRKAPDRPAVLTATWEAVIQSVIEKSGYSKNDIVISGKSMGGRYASMLAAEQPGVGGVILFGYPLHPPGKPEKLRFDHISAIHCPMLFIEGTRDSLCNIEKLKDLIQALPYKPDLHVIEGGDHSFKVLKRLNRTEQSIWTEITETTAQWIDKLG